MRTIERERLARLSFTNSPKLPLVVSDGGVRKEWVGIGWVEDGPSRGDEVVVLDEGYESFIKCEIHIHTREICWNHTPHVVYCHKCGDLICPKCAAKSLEKGRKLRAMLKAKNKDRYTDKELLLIRHFNCLSLIDYLDPMPVYGAMMEKAFISNEQSPYSEALRRCMKASFEGSIHRNSPEWDALIGDFE